MSSADFTPPVAARHSEPSMVFSADDERSRPSARLLDIALQAASLARTIELPAVSARLKHPPLYPDIWPGEHYRLLAALVELLQPKVILEIGTATGMSALAMRERLPAAGKILTFDLVPWDQFTESCFTADDFADGRIVQYIADLTKPWNLKLFHELILPAELIFFDAAKDGVGEQELIDLFRPLPFAKPPLVVFDDIRLWNMLAIWRGISAPKLDITSFGHWSGTGLVDWTW